VRDGDEWVVNGQKIWTTGAHYSKFGILIARTDPDAPKHKGITYFICPMDAPGIEVSNIRNIAGADSFNEVFFTDVRIPHSNVVGEVNDGWRLAKVTLGNERVSLSSGGVLWGAGPKATDIIDEARAIGITDAVMRQRLAALYIEHFVLEIIRMRTLSARLRGEQPGPEASIRKIMADEHGQRAMEIARDLVGMDALLTGSRGGEKTLRSRSWYSGYMFSKALTIGGGTGEVQRNILGERVLGLPPEPDDSTGKPWAETMRTQAKAVR
jgi:alkylation response protein AidB-like acyl-CoA dehydrogenase